MKAGIPVKTFNGGFNASLKRARYTQSTRIYYSSNEYKYKGYTYNPIGNYGIGFLSCFMLSSNVNIESKRYDDQKLNKIELERNSEYICLTQEQSTRMQGTDIILDLDQFIVGCSR